MIQALRTEIVEKAKQGDEEAMHHLYVLYSKALLNTAFRILNNREDAEDVLQDSFIKAFQNLNQFKYQSTFGAWIKRIVVNQSIDALKKKRKYVAIFESNEVSDRAHMSNEVNNQLSTKNKIDIIYKALHELPDGYRTVFSLYMVEGYDHKEIASILNIGVSASISQLSRAKKKLRLLISAVNMSHPEF